jgi:hypothetical protein
MGKEMYLLHDNGRKLFESARECTPMQRFVYIFARDYHEDDPQESHQDPHGLKQGNKFNQAKPF